MQFPHIHFAKVYWLRKKRSSTIKLGVYVVEINVYAIVGLHVHGTVELKLSAIMMNYSSNRGENV